MSTADASYGVDMWCGPKGLQTARTASGLRCLAQDVAHLLVTPEGKLQGSRTAGKKGVDLTRLIGSVSEASALAMMAPRIEQVVKTDDRVRSCKATVTEVSRSAAGLSTVRVRVSVVPYGSDRGFELTIAVGTDGTAIERIAT